MKRKLVLYNSQIPASDFAMDNAISVLGVAPNGGKTEISIDVICRYLALNPLAKVLVITHSTNVLKDNYFDRLNELILPFKYSKTFEANKQAHICLPHHEHLIKGHYDFIIVDEAHENYLAARMQRIVKRVKPKKQLLLTGTPAKFIKKGGYKIYTLAANQIPVEYFAKLQVELVATTYNWRKNLNGDQEVKKGYKFKKIDTKNALEEILLKIIDRLTLEISAEEFNKPEIVKRRLENKAKKEGWGFVYKKLGKSIIICRSIEQANHTNDILLENKVNSVLSHNESDDGSKEVANFKENKYDVLVVVDRARLGYSDVNLYNIIDMSGSHNPNVIYQIFARVLRGNPSMQKYYLKVTTQEQGMMDFTHICVSAALMLTDNKYLSTFNGDNFNGIKIPVIKKKPRQNSGSSSSGGNKPKDKKFIFPEFTNDVIDMFKRIQHSLDEPVSIYRLTTIGEVRAHLMGTNNKWTEETILETITG